MKTCKNCSKQFELTQWEKDFLAKMEAPEPTHCPACREQRRWGFRNERTLYSRTCDKCKKNMVSIYSSDKPYIVYCRECYFSDSWDPIDSGRDFDFSKPFFEQFEELLKATPLLGLNGGTNSINSDFVNLETDDKNCYMNVGGHYNENSYYNTFCLYGKECVDNYWVNKCELVYESSDCIECYNCFYCKNMSKSNDCWLSYDCRGCSNVFGCVNLRNKSYMIFNKQYSKEEYETKVKELTNGYQAIEKAKRLFEEEKLKHPHRFAFQDNIEDSTGNYLVDCKNVSQGFDVEKTVDSAHLQIAFDSKDSLDISAMGWGELAYDSMGTMKIHDVAWTMIAFPNPLSFSRYCFASNGSDNLFGCIGLQKKSYCILNKQYTKEEYESLKVKIIEHMKKTGEWGEFFPLSISPIGYNESVAQVYFPMTREEVLAKGWKWQDNMPHTVGRETIAWDKVSDRIQDAQDSIVKEILACTNCKANYKITPQELAFYRKTGLPIPRICPTCRYQSRMDARGREHILYERECMCDRKGHESHGDSKCGNSFETPYSPERKEIVFCSECFQKEVA